MHAIILAAGRGQRLQSSIPDGRPKCLIRIAGKSLLSRQLDCLLDAGVSQISLVLGFKSDQIIRHVAELDVQAHISFLHNPNYDQGSVLSLLTARKALQSESSVLVMDADVLFHPDILRRLCSSEHPNCVLLDRDFTPGEEPVKIAIRDKLIIEFRKVLPPDLKYDVLGESVGFFRFDGETASQLAQICNQFESQGKGGFPHEDAIRQLVLERPHLFGYEDVSGMPWIEIDFPDDVVKAEQVIFPAISASTTMPSPRRDRP